MRKSFFKKSAALLMMSSLVVSVVGCGNFGGKKSETITLDVYSQLANYSGVQTGWIADILKEKFNVKLNIIPEGDGVYETRMEEGNLGDIVVW